MINLCKPDCCCGCMSCVQICPHHAIHKEIKDGFYYPQIDSSLCVECGLCVRSCPVINSNGSIGEKHTDTVDCLAVWNRDDSVRMNSSSGGTFSALAELILNDGGVVFGAAWNDEMRLEHNGISSVDELDKLRRSKYVQSDTNDTFRQVKSLMADGKKVLYCGTPCQIAGLKAYLGTCESTNLFTVDVLCQGVPSPVYFKKYLLEISNETGGNVTDCNFRTKKFGWRCGLLLLLEINKKGKRKQVRRILDKNEYYNAFIKELGMRPSCYECQFKNDKLGYYSDITIADFWRIGTTIPFKVKGYNKGISAVILNTEKGRALLDGCADKLNMEVRSWKEFSSNGGLKSSKKSANNDEMMSYLENHSWRETQTKYFPLTQKEKAKVIMRLTLGEKKTNIILKYLNK